MGNGERGNACRHSHFSGGLQPVDDPDAPLLRDGAASRRSPAGGARPNALPLRRSTSASSQSAVYVALFIGLGLCVGVSGPALPYIAGRIPQGSSLATAFALRGVGGLAGSFAGAWALHSGVPGHAILAVGAMLGAAGVASLRVASSVAGVAAALVALDGGSGFLQVANTMIAWVQPKERLVMWLNVLNGVFGVGTFAAPVVVAALATLFGSQNSGVRQALVAIPVMAAVGVAALALVPSPRENTAASSDRSSAGGARYWASALLATIAVNGAVGAESTFAAFLVAYVASQRDLGILDVGDRQADMISSAFWFAFTTGRFVSMGLHSAFSHAPSISLWYQIGLMLAAAGSILIMPSSTAALWAGAIMMGAGVAGLFAGFMGQLAHHGIPIDSRVGGIMGIGVMTGIAFWQAAAASFDPHLAIHVVMCACFTTASAQLALQLLLNRDMCRARTQEGKLENRDVEALMPLLPSDSASSEDKDWECRDSDAGELHPTVLGNAMMSDASQAGRLQQPLQSQ